MKNLLFAGLVLAGLAVVGCNDGNDQQPLVTIEALTPTEVPTMEPTVVTTSLPCYTKSSDQRAAISAALNQVGGRVEKETFVLWVDGDCIRGTFDWGPANDFVRTHPGTNPSSITPTPNQQLPEWEREVGLTSGSVDGNVYWMSGVAPSDEVCNILNLRCYD